MPARGRSSCAVFVSPGDDGFDDIRKNETECKDESSLIHSCCLMRSPLSPCADDVNALNTSSRVHVYNHHQQLQRNPIHNNHNNHHNINSRKHPHRMHSVRNHKNTNYTNCTNNIHQLKRKNRFREMVQQSARKQQARRVLQRRRHTQKTAAKVCSSNPKVARFSKANKNKHKNKNKQTKNKNTKKKKRNRRKMNKYRQLPPHWRLPYTNDADNMDMDIDVDTELDYDLDSSSSQSQSPSLEPRKAPSSLSRVETAAAMHAHINYFQCPISAELLPAHLNLNRLLPNLANKLDVSEAFFYAAENGDPSVLFVKNAEFECSGQHRYVTIHCFEVKTVRCSTLGQLDCNVYFRRCPKLIVCRARRVLYLLGNAEADKFKLLQFCLRTHRVLAFVQQDAAAYRELCRTQLRCQHVLLSQFTDAETSAEAVAEEEEEEEESMTAVLNTMPSDEFLYDCSAGRHYKRYLYVPLLRRLLRFGGVHGADDSVQYIDLKQPQQPQPPEWRMYANVRLPGSALSMHFSLAKDYLLFIFDWKGGGDGHGKTWIVDLLFDERVMMQGAKSLETLFEYDFGVKVSPDYMAFLNGYSDASMVANFNEFIPPRLARYYDCKTLLLIHRFCERGCGQFIPLSLRQLIFGFYQPFF